MELSQIIPHIEALIFASDKPLTNIDLTELLNNALGFIDDRASIEQIEVGVEGIREKYSAEFYAFELKQSGGGWQFLTKKEYHKTVAQLNGDKFLKRLSVAALETLAIIAYKQPITKSEIEAIRGVNCDYAVQKLLEKDLVIIAGRNELAVGKPLIYATSKSFMDYFGINTTADLPKISEVLMEELIQATIVQPVEEVALAIATPTPVNPEDKNDHITAVLEAMPVTNAETIAAQNPLDESLVIETGNKIIETDKPLTNAEIIAAQNAGDEILVSKSADESEENPESAEPINNAAANVSIFVSDEDVALNDLPKYDENQDA